MPTLSAILACIDPRDDSAAKHAVSLFERALLQRLVEGHDADSVVRPKKRAGFLRPAFGGDT
jgi:hypothetical protein